MNDEFVDSGFSPTAEELDERDGSLDLRDFRVSDGLVNCCIAKAAAEPPHCKETLAYVPSPNLTGVSRFGWRGRAAVDGFEIIVNLGEAFA